MRLTKSCRLGGIFCTSCCLAFAVSVTAQPQPARPAGQHDAPPQLRLSLHALDPVLLKDQNLDDLSERDLAQLSRSTMGQFLVPLKGQDLTQIQVGQRVPVVAVSDEAGDRRGIRVSYEESGFTAQAGGTWHPTTSSAQVQLKITAVDLPSPQDGKPPRRREKPTLSKDFQLREGGAARLRFPEVVNEDAAADTVYIAFVELFRPQPRRVRVDEPAPAAPAPGVPRRTRIDLQILQVIVPAERAATMDADLLTRDEPNVAELLERLRAYGEPTVLLNYSDAADLAREYTVTAGQRVPTVQDVIGRPGRNVPSITYEEVGTILRLGDARWEQLNGHWICDLMATIETAALGESGVTVADGVTLPQFLQFRQEGRRRLVSGQSDFVVYHGMAYPPGGKPLVPVHVIRLLAVHLDP